MENLLDVKSGLYNFAGANLASKEYKLKLVQQQCDRIICVNGCCKNLSAFWASFFCV